MGGPPPAQGRAPRVLRLCSVFEPPVGPLTGAAAATGLEGVAQAAVDG